MSSRIESESNPLAEFFEHEDEDEVRRRRRGYRPSIRHRFSYANQPTRFLPRGFRRRFKRPFPRPRLPFGFPPPYPFPPQVQPPAQPASQGGPPPSFGSSGGAAPPVVSDNWEPQGTVMEPMGQPAPNGNGQASTEPGDGDVAQAPDAQPTGGDEEFFEFGAFEHEAPGRKSPTITLPTIVICGGPPFSSLDNFIFGKSTLRNDGIRKHQDQINAIALEIRNRAARGRPVPTVCIVGRTDVVGAQNFNYTLGLQRARSVKEALCKALGAYASRMTFVVNSLGEMDPTPGGTSPAARARNRRVDVHLLSQRTEGERCGATGGRRPPPDSTTCGFPATSPQREQEILQELEQFEQEAPARRVSVQPKLCLYQLATNTSHRNHFHHQATGTARRIGAIASPNASACNPRIGATPYGTGADIINAIRAAWQCTGRKPIKSVHIFGHSGSSGVFGNTLGTAGLYQNSISLDAASRTAGARNISDIPTDILASDVIFVLHGCNQAFGCNVQGDDDNFAQSLLEHLSGALTNPRVYGHYNSGCAGRHNSWCLYSKLIPKGRAHSSPAYSDPGGCATPSREVEVEMEQESGPCDRLQTFKIDDYGRGVARLSSSQQSELNRIKSAIRRRARNCGGISIVEIRGHSSTEGPAGVNKDLAQVRANVVKSALSITLGRARVFATSKGEEQPLITPDNTEPKQRKNRRVEIFVM